MDEERVTPVRRIGLAPILRRFGAREPEKEHPETGSRPWSGREQERRSAPPLDLLGVFVDLRA